VQAVSWGCWRTNSELILQLSLSRHYDNCTVVLLVRLHLLTQNDQIRHGQPRHCICTNASRGLSAIAEFPVSPLRSEVISARIWNKIYHFTLFTLPHYRIKCEPASAVLWKFALFRLFSSKRERPQWDRLLDCVNCDMHVFTLFETTSMWWHVNVFRVIC